MMNDVEALQQAVQEYNAAQKELDAFVAQWNTARLRTDEARKRLLELLSIERM